MRVIYVICPKHEIKHDPYIKCPECTREQKDHMFKGVKAMIPQRKLNPTDFTLEKPKRYQITNRITQQTYQASAFSATEACQKLGWMIGDCYVKEIGVG